MSRTGSVCTVKELLPDIDRWRARGEKVAVATVVATRRSSPRPVGSKLVVSESGELAGSVSGGCVESDVVLAAQDVLGGGGAAAPHLRHHRRHGARDRPPLRRRDRRLRRAARVTLFDELRGVVESRRPRRRPHRHRRRRRRREAARPRGRHDRRRRPCGARRARAATRSARGREPRDRARRPDALRRRLRAAAAAPRLRRDRHGRGALPRREAARLDDDRRRRPRPLRDRASGCRAPTSCSSRGPTRRSPTRPARLGTAIIVLTHDDKFDLPLLQAALASEAFYIGALGSRRNQERRRGLLLEAGVPEARPRADHRPVPASTSARSRPPRRRSRCSRRCSPSAPAAPAARFATRSSRIHAEPLAGKK